MDITDSRIIALSLYALVLGVALGICFLVFSLARMIVTPSKAAGVRSRLYYDLVTFIFDIAYALFSSCCVALLFFGANNGRIRLLGLVFCAVGFALWHMLVGRRLIRAAGKLVLCCRRILKKALMYTVVPVLHFLSYPFRKVVSDIRVANENRKKQKKRKNDHKKEGGFTL